MDDNTRRPSLNRGPITKSFDDVEDDLAAEYQRTRGDSTLDWDDARDATRQLGQGLPGSSATRAAG
jgi:hypothetical protein